MPTNVGPTELAVVSVIVLLFIARFLSRRGVSITGPALVLKRFDTAPSDPRTLLSLVGRPRGIVGWFLSNIGLDITTTLSINRDFVYVNQYSLSGRFRQTAPVHNIASTRCGYSMNLFLLILTWLAALGGLVAAAASREIWPLVIGMLLALLMGVGFVLSKCLMIAFETNGGAVLGIRFKRGVVENVPVSIEQLNEVIALFNEQMRRVPSTEPPAAFSMKEEQ